MNKLSPEISCKIMQLLAQAYCSKENSSKILDNDLIVEMTSLLLPFIADTLAKQSHDHEILFNTCLDTKNREIEEKLAKQKEDILREMNDEIEYIDGEQAIWGKDKYSKSCIEGLELAKQIIERCGK